jgi:predicted Zn-dependent protease
MKRKFYLAIILIMGFSFLIPSCAVNPVTGKKQLMFMSESQEIQLGKDYDPQVMATFGEYNNEALLALIEKRGKEMGLISHRPKLEYQFRILDTHVINAFAVPGGYIYFTRGILAQFNNEAELMGVLGHEMGHITARHSVSRQAKQQIGTLLLIGGMIASEEFRKYGEYAMAGMQLLFLSFSREDEREADRLGVEYASKIGFDAGKMADFYKVLVKMNMASQYGGVPTFLSTHPDPGDRYNAVKQDAAKWQTELNFEEWKVNADSYLDLINGMVYGEDPRQGFTDGNVFYHPDMKFRFSYPAGWQLQNSPMQVTMAPQDGKALMIFTLAQQKSLDEAAQTTLQQLELNLIESTRTTVNGMPAIATVSSQTSQDQATGQEQTIKVLSYFIDYNNSCFVFHGVSDVNDFDGYLHAFEASMRNFDRLTDPAKLNVKPQRIRISQVQRTGTLSEALKSMGVPAQEMEDIAFLNNLDLSEQVQAGSKLKLIGY